MKRNMTRKKKRSVAVYLLATGLAGGFLGCSGESHAPQAAPETVSGVAVITAQTASVPDWLEAVGTVRAAQFAQIASQTLGTIAEIRAQEGDHVQAGQVLATIDDTQQRAAVEQAAAAVTAAQQEVSSAESEFALADSTRKRYQQLFDKKSVSPQEFDEIKTRTESAAAHRDMARAAEAQANAALAQARTSLGYTQIRAPFAGVITEKKADAGALAAPGVLLFGLEDTRRYRLEATVDESDLRLVRLGEAVPVILDSLASAEFRGKAAQVVPAADPASRSFLVKIDLPADSRFRSGLFGRARFARGSRSALLIPRSTIVERGQLRGVFVVDANQVAQLRYVTLGTASAERVEVLSGLQAGEKLVATPGDRDLAGKQIGPRP
jgi:RND family efflux transporter MFP subunit